MFGELALSEKAFADHGILTLGSATADANFTLGQAATYIGVDAAEMSAIAVKLSVGSGILTGLIDATLEFTQSSAGTRFATGISEQDAAFIQSAAANTIRSGISEQEAAFIASILGGAITNNPASLEAVFVQTSDVVAVRTLISEQEASFTQSSLGGLPFFSELEVTAAFIQTTEGRLYWDIWTGSPGNSPQENWVQISPTGGTWTEINAGAIISTWTEKVV